MQLPWDLQLASFVVFNTFMSLNVAAPAEEEGTCSVQIYDSIPDSEEIRAFWKRSQWHPNADFDFFSLICSVRAEHLRPCVIVIRNKTTIRLVLAGRLEDSTERIGLAYWRPFSMKIRRLRIVEGGIMGSCHDCLFPKIFRDLINVLRHYNAHMVTFDYLPLASDWSTALRGVPAFWNRSHGDHITPHWKISLPGSLNEFLARRKKKHRYWLNRILKQLDTEFPKRVQVRYFASMDDVKCFCTEAEAIARLSYHRALGAGFIDNDENRQRLSLDAKHSRFRGYVLYIDGSPRAFWCGSNYNNAFHLFWTAYDPAFRQYEIGTALFLRLIEDLCQLKIKEIDMGLGDASYKERFGDEKWDEASFHLFPSSPRGLAINASRSVCLCLELFGRRFLQSRLLMKLKTTWRKRLISRCEAPQPSSAVSELPAN
jgi:ribosomal protein S18 acetylase RimI-like enzyme